jgi:adenine specific DNA methylase Mod
MFMVYFMMLIFLFDYIMEHKEKLEMIIENKGCIIEGDPTYLVIILFIIYPYHKKYLSYY